MKKVLFIAMLMLGVTSQAQTAVKPELKKVYNLDEERKALESDSNTGSTAIYHGVSYPVYISAGGKLYINVISKKSGKPYRKYIQ
jgi:hypothetical protein